ncbi:hypothetical protein BIU88_06330 [Chlorobaculum limnaeum]|uniref:Uncharacterized protein n=1 Tax=Chlorobaculum limnaeum TaxID=274537 RepID=A0A1D8D075_CHLLM|nr:hypothetical protein BIU88_06330 [Chlorobaculum limnaeum]
MSNENEPTIPPDDGKGAATDTGNNSEPALPALPAKEEQDEQKNGGGPIFLTTSSRRSKRLPAK